MKKTLPIVLMSLLVAAPAVAAETTATPVSVEKLAAKGKLVVDSNGSRLGSVSRVASDGSAQIILEGKLVTIPASTLSMVDGKLTTSMTKKDLR